MEQDFRELLEGFNGEKVRYLVVGGDTVTKYTGLFWDWNLRKLAACAT